jgi:hypothetical protein
LKPLRNRWTSISSTLSKRTSQPKCKLHSWSHQRKCQMSPHSTQIWLLTSTRRRDSWILPWTSMLTTRACRDSPLIQTRNQCQIKTQVYPTKLRCTKWTQACHSTTWTTLSQSLNLVAIKCSSQLRLKDRDYHLKTNSQLT